MTDTSSRSTDYLVVRPVKCTLTLLRTCTPSIQLIWSWYLSLLFAGFFLLAQNAHASSPDKTLPRFATLKSDQINARTGPGISFPIEWVFVSKGEPVKIIAEYEEWRKVEDITGLAGWVHSSVLSPKRAAVIVNDGQSLYRRTDKDGRILAKLEKGLRCPMDKIDPGWVRLRCGRFKGWVETMNIWGITKAEGGF